jgi:hypothetical protein
MEEIGRELLYSIHPVALAAEYLKLVMVISGYVNLDNTISSLESLVLVAKILESACSIQCTAWYVHSSSSKP